MASDRDRPGHRSWVDALGPQDWREQSLQVLTEDGAARLVGHFCSMHLGELGCERAASGVAAVENPARAQLAHSHLDVPSRWVGTSQVGEHIAMRSNRADAPFPVAASMAADQWHVGKPR